MNCTRILPHTRMGQITSPIRIWDAHTRMGPRTRIGAPYAYGQPIHVWDSRLSLRVYFSYLGLMDCHPQLAPTAYDLKISIPFLFWISIPFLKYCTYNTLATRSHSLSLVPPLSTINARRYSYFVRVCFVWNQVPIDILGIATRTAFRHAAYKHCCGIF